MHGPADDETVHPPADAGNPNASLHGKVGADDTRSPLGRLRLLVALDALMVEQSVGRAAQRMGLGTPAMSRLLKQIREIYGDPILIKTARGMAPTPFAETLRLRLRALASEAEDLIQSPLEEARRVHEPRPSNRLPLMPAPPLAIEPGLDLGGPTPASFAAKLAAIGPRAEPHQRLARFIATIGAGAGRSRPLTVEESEEAFTHILGGKADPIQIGALLAVLQYRRATASEIAGLGRAIRTHIGAFAQSDDAADLDWPAYMSPKIVLQPWFLMAARLVADAGIRVIIHGSAGHMVEGERLDAPVAELGIPIAKGLAEAAAYVGAQGIAYLPYHALTSQMVGLMGLYRLFEMRSPINQAVHLVNPLGATTTLMGAFQSTYQALPRDAAALMGWRNLTVSCGMRDVAEATPRRATPLMRLVETEPVEVTLPSTRLVTAARPNALSAFDYWTAVWRGMAPDPVPVQTVIDTAAIALMTVRNAPFSDWPKLREEAAGLWRQRRI